MRCLTGFESRRSHLCHRLRARAVESVRRWEVADERLLRPDRDDAAAGLPDAIEQRGEQLPPSSGEGGKSELADYEKGCFSCPSLERRPRLSLFPGTSDARRARVRVNLPHRHGFG